MDTEHFGSDRMWGLKELSLPEPISWFPATEGWLVVAVLLLFGVAWVAWRLRRSWLRARYRRQALVRLAAIESGAAGIDELPELLRRTALAAFAREEVAALRGTEWVAWLNAHGGRFEPAAGGWLDRLPYDAAAAGQIDSGTTVRLIAASRRWVKAHRALP